MGHSIQGFLVSQAAVLDARAELQHTRAIAVGQGLYFVPVTDDVFDAIGAVAPTERSIDFTEFQRLSEALVHLAIRLSLCGPVAYVETDYFGGVGTQSAVAWDKGELMSPPAHGSGGIINAALRRMGVRAGQARDEFDTLGLGRFRRNEAWLEAP